MSDCFTHRTIIRALCNLWSRVKKTKKQSTKLHCDLGHMIKQRAHDIFHHPQSIILHKHDQHTPFSLCLSELLPVLRLACSWDGWLPVIGGRKRETGPFRAWQQFNLCLTWPGNVHRLLSFNPSCPAAVTLKVATQHGNLIRGPTYKTKAQKERETVLWAGSADRWRRGQNVRLALAMLKQTEPRPSRKMREWWFNSHSMTAHCI